MCVEKVEYLTYKTIAYTMSNSVGNTMDILANKGTQENQCKLVWLDLCVLFFLLLLLSCTSDLQGVLPCNYQGTVGDV